MNTKEFSTISKGAKRELKGTFTSPFVICNLLNKAAKGDFNKVANCDVLTRENLAKVAKVVKSLHNNRYAFDICVFPKNAKGEICTISTSKRCPKFGYDLINIDEKGYSYLVPVTLSVIGVFSAFAKVAKVEIRTNEKAESEAKKAAKAAKKQAETLAKAKAALISIFGESMYQLSDVEILDKYNLIKKVK